MIGAESDAIPDAIEPIRAWRVWIIGPESYSIGSMSPGDNFNIDPVLKGTASMGKQPWIRGTTTAVCSKGKDHGDVMAPGDDCSCGLYAAAVTDDGLDLLMKNWYGRLEDQAAVMGEVRLWGRVVPAERGYRAQHGRIAGFYRTWGSDPAWLKPLLNKFKVPLLEVPSGFANKRLGWLLYGGGEGVKGRKLREVNMGKPRHSKAEYASYVFRKSGQDIETCECDNCRLTPYSPGIKDLNGDCLDKPKPASIGGAMKAPPPEESSDFLSLKDMLSMRKRNVEQYDRLLDVLDKMKGLK